MKQAGFTLIEALVVISILTVMTSFLVLHNRTSEQQIILIKEKANLISVLLRAKNLASGVLIEEAAGATVCGYGVHLSDDDYFIYRDLAADCRASDFGYSGDNSGEKLVDETFQLPTGIEFAQKDIDDVLFVPPLPDTIFDGQWAVNEAALVLADDERLTEFEVVINSVGQISER